MSLSIASDLGIFFDLNAFATPAAIQGGATIPVIFDREYGDVVGIDLIEGRTLSALCKTSDVVGVSHGRQITINSIAYTVVGVKPQNDGLTTALELKE